MMKNLMLAAAATVGLFGASELTSQARADVPWNIGINFGRPGYPTYYPPSYYPPRYPPVIDRRHRAHYHVEYRAYRWGPWVRYGTYRSHGLAHDVEERLQRQGYIARVVHHD